MDNYLSDEREKAPCYGKKHGHNYAGGRCLNCGGSQTGTPIQKVMGMRPLSWSKPKKVYTSEMQALVDEIRTSFADTSTKGIGSFPFYCALIKKVGIPFATQKFYEAKSSGTNARSPKRLFVWMLKQEIAKMKERNGTHL